MGPGGYARVAPRARKHRGRPARPDVHWPRMEGAREVLAPSGEKRKDQPRATAAPFLEDVGVGGLLDHTVHLIHRHAVLLAILLLTAVLPLRLAAGLALEAVGFHAFEPGAPILREWAHWGLPLYLLRIAVETVLINPLAAAAMTFAFATSYLGGKPTARTCVIQTLWAAPRILLGMFLWHVAVLSTLLLGLFPAFLALLAPNASAAVAGPLFVVGFLPALFLMYGLYVYLPVLILERWTVIQAFRRTWRLMEGRRLRALALHGVTLLIVLPMTYLTEVIPAPYADVIVLETAGVLYLVLVHTGALTVYYGARCHHEHFDLERRIADLDAPPPASSESRYTF